MEEEDNLPWLQDTITFIFEVFSINKLSSAIICIKICQGVVLLIVALVGLTGNLISFISIFRQKVQKTFHNLLFLLTLFDMVSSGFY